ncbi:MAG: LamG domain-containing protein [archaeon]
MGDKKKVTLSLDNKIYTKFQKFCIENGIIFSRKIELLVRDFLRDKKLMVFLFGFIFFLFFISAATFIDNSQTDFNLGTYSNTFYNSSGFVQLNITEGYLSGTYESQIFNPGFSSWDIISWVQGGPYKIDLPDNGITETDWIFGNANMSGNLLLLHLEESGGATSFNDDSGYNENFTCVDSACPIAGVPGVFGNALEFDGNNDKILDQDPTNIGPTEAITMEAWIYWHGETGAANDAQNIITNGLWNRAMFVTEPDHWNGGSQLATILRIGQNRNVYSNKKIPQNIWTHVAVTYDGSEIVLFINGERDNSFSISGLIAEASYITAIGTEETSMYFDGLIDEPAIYERALSEQELLDHYKRGALNINVSVRTCDDAFCSGENFVDLADSSPQILSLNNNNYFQYRFEFLSFNESVTPALYNVTISYTILDSEPPSVFIFSPTNSNYSNNSVFVNISASDPNLDSIWFYDGSINVSYSYPIYHDFGQGDITLVAYANDSSGNLNSSSISFSIDSISPLITIISPTNSNYSNNSVFVNISTQDTNLDSVWFFNGTHNISYSLGYYDFDQGSNSLVAYANDTFGHVTLDSVNFYVDTLGPVINLIRPESKTYGYNISIPINFTVSDSLGVDDCWYNLNNGTNISGFNCMNTTFNASDGNYILYFFSNDSLGNLNSASIGFSVSTDIAVVLEFPLDGNWIDYNDVFFNYTVNTLAEVYNCSLYGDWNGWHLNQTNSSEVNTGGEVNNFTLFLPDGTYLWNVYCYGFFDAFAFSNFTFNIDSQDPSLEVHFPLNNTLFNRNVSLLLNFSIYDTNLEKCWYVFGNGSNISFGCSEGSNEFYFSYPSDIYNFTLYANDSAGNMVSVTSYNITINYDAIVPNASIMEPISIKKSVNNIPIQFSAGDNADLREEMNCWFNVTYNSTGGAVSGLEQVFLSKCENSSFNVLSDGDYNLYLTVRDKTGNVNVESTSFSVDTSLPPSGSSSSSSSGSSSSSSSGGRGISLKTELWADEISRVVVNTIGIKKILIWNVKNTGTSFLNDCVFESKGNYSSWITYSETKGLAAGQAHEIVFDINIPENIGSGIYDLEVYFVCQEINVSQSFEVEILDKTLDFILINVEREEAERVRVGYSLEEMSGEGQDVELQFLLFDSNNKKVAEINETRFVVGGGKENFNIFIPIDELLEGELGLLINVNSDTYSGFVQENIILGSSISGFTIFDRIGNTDNFVSIALVALFLGFTFFIVKRIRNHRKGVEYKVKSMIRKNRGSKFKKKPKQRKRKKKFPL